jgi:hypothetical protein
VQPGAGQPTGVAAKLRLEPVRSALQQAGVTQLLVYLEHVPAGESTLSPPARTSWFADGQQIDMYMPWLRDGVPDLSLSYGFSGRQVQDLRRAATVWALSALLLVALIRLWLLNMSAPFRSQLADSVWLVFRWSFWVAWLTLSIYFHGLAIAGFWSGGEGLGAALRAITWYGSLAWLLRAGTELIISGATIPFAAEMGLQRLLLVCLFRSASEAPFAVVILFLSNPQAPLGFGLLIMLAAIAAAGMLLAQHGLKLATGLKGAVVHSGELYDAVFALAKRMGVSLKRLYIQPEGEWKNLTPSTGTAGNLMLPERLLRSVSRREVDALAAYALLTVKTGHVRNAIQAAVMITLVFLVHAYRSQIFEPGTFLLLGQIVLATEGFMSLLRYMRRKRERIQAQLLTLTSDGEGWAAAVAHTARLAGSALSQPALEKMAQNTGVSLERLTMLAESGLPQSGTYPVPDFNRDRLVVLK